MHGDRDAEGVRGNDRDDDRHRRIEGEPQSDDRQLNDGRGEHRPDRLVDPAGRVDPRVQDPDNESDRYLDDDQECVQVRYRVVTRGLHHCQRKATADGHQSADKPRQHQPTADLVLAGLALPESGERPQPVPHDFEQSPPAAGHHQTPRPQHHHDEGRDPTETGQYEEELRDVDGEPHGRDQERKAQPIAEVAVEPTGEKAGVQRHRGCLPTAHPAEPAVDVVHRRLSHCGLGPRGLTVLGQTGYWVGPGQPGAIRPSVGVESIVEG